MVTHHAVDCAALAKTIAALTVGETGPVALMATVACKVHFLDARFNWTGFYRVVAPEVMKIGPYQGGHGCLVISFSRGVCGAVARSVEAQIVADVAAFAGHIACDSATRSELVLPVFSGSGRLLGVFDIDSHQANAFGVLDAEALKVILAASFANVSEKHAVS